MEITLNTSVTFYGKHTKSELQQFLDAIPDEAVITVSTYKGDQRDPGNTTTYSAKWNSAPKVDKPVYR